jgi:hypothetical protein
MSLACVAAAALLFQPVAPPAKIAFVKNAFQVQFGKTVAQVPLQPPLVQSPALPEKVQFRKDDAFAVWDARGLTIRHANYVKNTRLEAGPTHARLFSGTELADNRLLLDLGLRDPRAKELIAARRFGDWAIFAFEWRENDGRPWFQAIARVNLSERQPQPQFLARLNGHLVPLGSQENTLQIRQGILTYAESDGKTWWITRVDLKTLAVDRKPMGSNLEQITMHSGRIAHVLETTPQKSTALARVDFVSRNRKDLAEATGLIRLIDTKEPWIAVTRDSTGLSLHNLESGAKRKIRNEAKFRRAPGGVLVWTGNPPDSAMLLDPERWSTVTTWAAKPPIKPAAKPKP